jgi:hypothetical protein
MIATAAITNSSDQPMSNIIYARRVAEAGQTAGRPGLS